MHPTNTGWLIGKWILIPIGILAFAVLGYNAIRVGEGIPFVASVGGILVLGALWVYNSADLTNNSEAEGQ